MKCDQISFTLLPNEDVEWPCKSCMATYLYRHIYIYIYVVKSLSGPSLALLEVIIWSKFVFSKTPIAKNTIKIGVSAFFLEKIARKKWKLLSGPSWRFLRRSQLGPDNNFQLGPDNNFPKMPFFVFFCFEKCAKMPIFIVF